MPNGDQTPLGDPILDTPAAMPEPVKLSTGSVQGYAPRHQKQEKEKKPLDPIVKLRNPLQGFTGAVKELNVDPDKLEMADYHNLELEFNDLWPGRQPTMGVFMADTKYRALVVGRINNIRYEEICKLRGRDMQAVDLRFQSFLAPEE